MESGAGKTDDALSVPEKRSTCPYLFGPKATQAELAENANLSLAEFESRDKYNAGVPFLFKIHTIAFRDVKVFATDMIADSLGASMGTSDIFQETPVSIPSLTLLETDLSPPEGQRGFWLQQLVLQKIVASVVGEVSSSAVVAEATSALATKVNNGDFLPHHFSRLVCSSSHPGI